MKPERFPFLVMAISVFLWQVSFIVSTCAAAYKRKGKWDNRTPRNLPEKKSGLPFRAQSAHYNEGEQFAITFVVVLASLQLQNDVEWINFCLSGWVIHRVAYHLCYWTNIHALRSFTYLCAFWCTLFMLMSCVYEVDEVDGVLKGLADRIPIVF